MWIKLYDLLQSFWHELWIGLIIFGLYAVVYFLLFAI